jgi:hypothetical protein
MPTVPRPGIRPVYVELEQALADQLEELARRNRRTLKAEITIALEKHVGEQPAALPVCVPDQGEGHHATPARTIEEGQAELPSTRGRYLIFIGEPILKGPPRWVHFSWRNESFCLRDFRTGVILRQDLTRRVADVWRAATKRKPAIGEYFHPVGDWEWWKGKLAELSEQK